MNDNEIENFADQITKSYSNPSLGIKHEFHYNLKDKSKAELFQQENLGDFVSNDNITLSGNSKPGPGDIDSASDKSLIIKVIISFIFPYLILYSLYIQVNGEVSPGGGFQAGVIFASAIIAADLIKMKIDFYNKILKYEYLITAAVIGVLIYAGTGLVSLFVGDNYLNYYSLSLDRLLMLDKAQNIIETFANNASVNSASGPWNLDNNAVNIDDLSVNFATKQHSQTIGIVTIEIGVGITVAAVMSLIYTIFQKLIEVGSVESKS